MFHPIGPQSQSVYWRRRLVALAFVVFLLILAVMTVKAMRSDGASAPAAQPKSSQPAKTTAPASTSATSSATSSATTQPPKSSASSRKSTSAAATSGGKSKASGSAHAAADPVLPCVVNHLELHAMVGQTAYQVGDSPLLQLQVTNPGSAPCTQNLSDQDVQMLVYNGESRVWGSHDCKVVPGNKLRTLEPHVPVVVSLPWSGLSSQPKCAGTRQRVNAGTYTLYAALGGRTGNATQFSIS